MENSAGRNIAAQIPHRGLMHWLDDAHMDGETVVATRCITAAQPFVSRGILVRSALVEMLSQAAACEAAQAAGTAGRTLRQGSLVGIRELLFTANARVGQTIELRSRRERTLGPLVLCAVEARVDGVTIARGRMTFHLTLQ